MCRPNMKKAPKSPGGKVGVRKVGHGMCRPNRKKALKSPEEKAGVRKGSHGMCRPNMKKALVQFPVNFSSVNYDTRLSYKALVIMVSSFSCLSLGTSKWHNFESPTNSKETTSALGSSTHFLRDTKYPAW